MICDKPLSVCNTWEEAEASINEARRLAAEGKLIDGPVEVDIRIAGKEFYKLRCPNDGSGRLGVELIPTTSQFPLFRRVVRMIERRLNNQGY